MTVVEPEEEYIRDPANFEAYVKILIEEHQKSGREQIGDANAVKPHSVERKS